MEDNILKRSAVVVILIGMTILFAGRIQPLLAEGDGSGNGSGNSNSSNSDVATDNATTATVTNIGPYGGNTWDIAIDATHDMIYTTAKDAPNGVYRSSNGGASWEGLSGVDYGGGVAVELNPSNGYVFALFSNGLYRSTDAGVTYTKITDHYGAALAFDHNTLVLLASEGGIAYVSSDDGVTWSEATVTSGANMVFLYVTGSPTDGEFFAVGFDSSNTAHLYKSSDSGVNWTELTIPTIQDNSWGAQISVDPINANYMVLSGGYSDTSYQSVNGGTSWTVISPAGQAVVFDGTGRVYLGGEYSDDRGATWQSMGRDANDNNTALGGHAMIIDPTNTNIIYADGMPGISKSTDRGATWSDINSGIAGVKITDISQATNKDIVWAAAYNGVAKTENFTSSSVTWTFPVLPDPASAIWTLPDNPNVVVVGELGAMKRSSDGGTTWSDNLVSGLMSSSYQVNQIIVDVTDGNKLYAAVGNNNPNNPKLGMVLQSTDLGETWTDLSITDNASAQAIAQASDGTLYVGVGAEGGNNYVAGIYKYSNGTWSFLSSSPAEEIVQVAVDPHDDNIVYAVASIAYGNNDTGKFGFYKSSDAGATWTKITENLDNNQEFNSLALQSSTAPTTLYLGAVNYSGQGVLYKSSDAGTTWGLLYTGLKQETFYTLLFDGVTLGTTRGLFNVTSKVAITLKAKPKKVTVGNAVTFTITLKDAVTNKALKKQRVQLLKKQGNHFKKVKTIKTNKKGVAKIVLPFAKAKKYTFEARWNPKATLAEEYTSVVSDTVKVTVKK
ncbi:MAG: hypothetical protein WCW27_04245 [Patescibacteria group bacterium]|jgi:hypothetical protein